MVNQPSLSLPGNAVNFVNRSNECQVHFVNAEVALEIVSRVRDAVPSQVPVTLKMRRGMDDSDESRERFEQSWQRLDEFEAELERLERAAA